jgi:murein L,D-transpeptidase YafK
MQMPVIKSGEYEVRQPNRKKQMPNNADKKRAKETGANPGGFIMIHGQKNGLGWLSWITQRLNWTDGCIAVSNAAMDEIWNSVDVGTPIEIKP